MLNFKLLMVFMCFFSTNASFYSKLIGDNYENLKSSDNKNSADKDDIDDKDDSVFLNEDVMDRIDKELKEKSYRKPIVSCYIDNQRVMSLNKVKSISEAVQIKFIKLNGDYIKKVQSLIKLTDQDEQQEKSMKIRKHFQDIELAMNNSSKPLNDSIQKVEKKVWRKLVKKYPELYECKKIEKDDDILVNEGKWVDITSLVIEELNASLKNKKFYLDEVEVLDIKELEELEE